VSLILNLYRQAERKAEIFFKYECYSHVSACVSMCVCVSACVSVCACVMMIHRQASRERISGIAKQIAREN
jgi:hypothetical protein